MRGKSEEPEPPRARRRPPRRTRRQADEERDEVTPSFGPITPLSFNTAKAARVLLLVYAGSSLVIAAVMGVAFSMIGWTPLFGRQLPSHALFLAIEISSLSGGLISLATLVSSALWLYAAFRSARSMGASGLPTPGGALLAYVTPITNLYKPFRQMQALHAASDPTDLPEPVEREQSVSGGYRDHPARALRASPWNPNAPIGTWWLASTMGVGIFVVEAMVARSSAPTLMVRSIFNAWAQWS